MQLLVVAFALAIAVVAAEGAADGVNEKEFASMGKEQLVQELTKAHAKAEDTALQLESAHDMITKLQVTRVKFGPRYGLTTRIRSAELAPSGETRGGEGHRA